MIAGLRIISQIGPMMVGMIFTTTSTTIATKSTTTRLETLQWASTSSLSMAVTAASFTPMTTTWRIVRLRCWSPWWATTCLTYPSRSSASSSHIGPALWGPAYPNRLTNWEDIQCLVQPLRLWPLSRCTATTSTRHC